MDQEDLTPLRVARKAMLTPDIHEFELRHPDGAALPPFSAGAHLTVEVPTGARRTYSLSNDPAETERYVLGVKREAGGRGGSIALVERVAEGDLLPVSAPINQFPLVEAPAYLFIAGGIGITPILSMIRQVVREGRAQWRLIYCTRSPESTPYREILSSPGIAENVVLHHDAGVLENIYDFWDDLEKPSKAHIYCCGPAAMMEDVRGMSGHWPQTQVHFEDFAPPARAEWGENRPFTVRLAKTGQSFEVAADKTILETLRAAGLRVPSSCESGTCGTCRTRLVSGEVEHRDMVLQPEERDGAIMLCVSRAKSGELVIDP